MINTRNKKLSGMHVGHIYIVVAPYSEIETRLRWTLQMEDNEEEKLVVAEDELTDTKYWQPLD
jgi:hypothetical protein